MNRPMLWCRHLRDVVRAWRRSERGANILEYALLVALIAIVCLLGVTFIGESTSDRFSSTASQIP